MAEKKPDIIKFEKSQAWPVSLPDAILSIAAEELLRRKPTATLGELAAALVGAMQQLKEVIDNHVDGLETQLSDDPS